MATGWLQYTTFNLMMAYGGGEDNLVEVWDVETETPRRDLASSIISRADGVRILPGGESLLVNAGSETVMWSLETGKATRIFPSNYVGVWGEEVVWVESSTANPRSKSWSKRRGSNELPIRWRSSPQGEPVTFDADKDVLALTQTERLFVLHRESSNVIDVPHGVWWSPKVIVNSESNTIVLFNDFDQVIEVRDTFGKLQWRRHTSFLGDPINPDVAMTIKGDVFVTDHAKVWILDGKSGEVKLTVDPVLLCDSHDPPPGADKHVHDLSQITPVFLNGLVVAMLRRTSIGTEHLSVTDGTVSALKHHHGVDAEHGGFGISNPDGTRWLLVGDSGAGIWYPQSGSTQIIDIEPVAWRGSNAVAFSEDGRTMYVAEEAGHVSVWNLFGTDDLAVRVARLVSYADGGWAVIGTDGRYDASDPGDMAGLSWVLPDEPREPIPLPVYFRDYYEPMLLPRLLSGEKLGQITGISELDRRRPQVEIVRAEASKERRVDVWVRVSRNGAKVFGDLNLFRNGRLVGVDASGASRGTQETYEVAFRDIALPTGVSRVVDFSAYAFNGDGIKSDTAHYRYASPVAPLRSRKAFVVVVGVNAHENPSWDLRYAAEDARAIGTQLRARLANSGSFDEVVVTSLISDRDRNGRRVGAATKAHLLAVLDVLATGRRAATLNDIPGAESLDLATPDDMVLLAFSGHGLAGRDGKFHLFPSDIGEGIGRTISEELVSRTVDTDILSRYLLQVDAGEFLLVFDACNSAASVEGQGFKPGPMGSRGLGQLAYNKGYASSRCQPIRGCGARKRSSSSRTPYLCDGT